MQDDAFSGSDASRAASEESRNLRLAALHTLTAKALTSFAAGQADSSALFLDLRKLHAETSTPFPSSLAWRLAASTLTFLLDPLNTVSGKQIPCEVPPLVAELRTASCTMGGRTRSAAALLLDALTKIGTIFSESALESIIAYIALAPACPAGHYVLSIALADAASRAVFIEIARSGLGSHAHLLQHPLVCPNCACPLVAPRADVLGVLRCQDCVGDSAGNSAHANVAALALIRATAREGVGESAALRARGRAELSAGNAAAAADTFAEAARAAQGLVGGGAHAALGNESLAAARLGDSARALAAARDASSIAPLCWAKGDVRLASAEFEAGAPRAALRAALRATARINIAQAAAAGFVAHALFLKGDARIDENGAWSRADADRALASINRRPEIDSSSSADAYTASALAGATSSSASLALSDDEAAAALAWLRAFVDGPLKKNLAAFIRAPSLFNLLPGCLSTMIRSDASKFSMRTISEVSPYFLLKTFHSIVPAIFASAPEGDASPVDFFKTVVDDSIADIIDVISMRARGAREEARILARFGCLPLPPFAPEDPEASAELPCEWSWQRDDSTPTSAFTPLSAPILSDSLQCGICFGVVYEPCPLPSCGHTLCRPCVQRMLDHKAVCPSCRAPADALVQSRSYYYSCCGALFRVAACGATEELAERAAAIAAERAEAAKTLPVFVCSLVLPNQSCPLHIFEPRYRLMMRRVLQDKSRVFGMTVHAPYFPGGYPDVGVRVRVNGITLLPDGRSFIECTATAERYRVISRGIRDAYNVAETEALVDDDRGNELDNEEIRSEFAMLVRFFKGALALAHSTSIDEMQGIIGRTLDATEQVVVRTGSHILRRVLVESGIEHPTEIETKPQELVWHIGSLAPFNDSIKYAMLTSTSFMSRITLLIDELENVFKLSGSTVQSIDNLYEVSLSVCGVASSCAQQ